MLLGYGKHVLGLLSFVCKKLDPQVTGNGYKTAENIGFCPVWLILACFSPDKNETFTD